MIENWKPVVGFEGMYEVSDLGRVRSVARTDTFGRNVTTRVLRPCRQKSGHLRVTLCKAGKHRFLVHRLVLGAFSGPCPEGMEGCHGPDRDPANCQINNLRWDTRKSNHSDKVAHGTAQCGERNGFAKLSDKDVRVIFDLHSHGLTYVLIAKRVGVHRTTVARILHGERWAHLGLSPC